MNRAPRYIKSLAAWAFIGLCLPGCDERNVKPNRRIRFYSGGRIVKEWQTSYFWFGEGVIWFDDHETGRRVGVTGNVIIESIVDAEKKPQA